MSFRFIILTVLVYLATVQWWTTCATVTSDSDVSDNLTTVNPSAAIESVTDNATVLAGSENDTTTKAHQSSVPSDPSDRLNFTGQTDPSDSVVELVAASTVSPLEVFNFTPPLLLLRGMSVTEVKPLLPLITVLPTFERVTVKPPELVPDLDFNAAPSGTDGILSGEAFQTAPPSVLHTEEILPGPPSPFLRVEAIISDFESQVVALHTEFCGTTCFFAYSGSRDSKARGCSPCFCDYLCHLYDDCCPDVQLFNSISMDLSDHFPLSWEETKALSQGRDLYTCEKTHLKPAQVEDDYDNYFSMVNYCPRTSHSGNSSLETKTATNSSDQGTSGQSSDAPVSGSAKLQTPESLEAKCENKGNSSHWHYVRPVSSGYGVVYRNQFCAKCHGENQENLTDWTISIKCDADLLQTATSVSEAYFMAANTPGCDIRFNSRESSDVLRRCKYVNPPVISTCNETGLWRFYDERVERACASFTSVVKRKYKNGFCFLCNTDLPYEGFLFELNQEFNGNNVGRASFYALLDFDGDDKYTDETKLVSSVTEGNGTNSTGKREECETGTIRDPLNCQCRAVQCGPGLRVKGGKCSEVFASSNYFGFAFCSRLRMTSSKPIDSDVPNVFLHDLRSLPGLLTTEVVTGLPRLDCDDNTTLTMDIHMTVYSSMAMKLTQMGDFILSTLGIVLPQHWSALWSANVTITTPVSDCLDISQWALDIPPNCSTRDSTLSMGVTTLEGPRMHDNSVDQVSFLALYNTTFCPHVNLTKDEFKNYTSKLSQLGMSEKNVSLDVVSAENVTFYLVCAEDYHKILTRDTCMSEENDTSTTGQLQTFEDTWTIVGVISIVCTCITLVSLLCVIVTYVTLPPLRAGTGLSTLAMACLLFVAQALHELGIEQFDIRKLCLVLAILIHFFWLSSVFMMTSCTLQLFFCMMYPLKARYVMASRKMLAISLSCSSVLSAAVIGMTMLGNHLVYGDLGYPAKYLCFINRSLSRQLGFGLPLGLAVIVNVILFTVTVMHIRRRPQVSSSRQDKVSLVACFRLSVMTGASWLSLFLLAVPGTRPWLEYVFVVLLGFQGLLLATTLLINARVLSLWREFFRRRNNRAGRPYQLTHTSSNGDSKTALAKTDMLAPSETKLSDNVSSTSCDLSNI